MSRSVSPINDPCCTKPPNPWLRGVQGPQGCICDANCIGPQGPVRVRYERSVSPKHVIPVEWDLEYLNSRNAAFASGASGVNTRLNAALLMPNSTAATVAAIPSQNAAALVNKANAAGIIAPQAAAVAAATSSMAATTAARLAYRAACDAKAAYNAIKNINMDQLAELVLKAKLATDALVPASVSANAAAQGVYNTAGSIESAAIVTVTEATNALTQVEVEAAVASCNTIPGSADAKKVTYENNIKIAAARRQLELAKNAATAATSSGDSTNTVAISTANALVAANTASANAILVNNYFTDAAIKKARVLPAIVAYDNDILNAALRTDLQNKQAAADAAFALLPPLSAMNDLVTSTAQASYLANIAAANAKALSTSLDIKARAAAAPARTTITPQMIATQTAAAERFGAAAAAAAARAARISAAPPVPPVLPPPGHAPYSVRMPPSLFTTGPISAEVTAQRAARAMASNSRDYTYNIYRLCKH